MKQLIFFSFLSICFAQRSNAQLSVNYFPFQSIVSITMNPEKKLWADYKIETNTFSTNMNMELSAKYTIKQNVFVNYYFGTGFSFNFANTAVGLNLINGYFIDFGCRIKAFEKNKKIQIIFELSPYVNHEFKTGNLRSRLGLGYNF